MRGHPAPRARADHSRPERRRAWSARGAVLATLSLVGAGAVWSACSIDDRSTGLADASVEIGRNQGGSGGGGPGSSASVQITPSAIDLGPVVVGAPARMRLHIANEGDSPIEPPSVSIGAGSDPAYAIIHDGCESPVAPGEECEVRLQVLAQHGGAVTGELLVNAAGSDNRVPLSATGNPAGTLILAPAAGSSDNFGSVRLGTSVQSVFNLTNSGSVATGPLAVHLYNDDVTPVVGMAGGCVNGQTSLDPGQTCDVHLAYGPSRRGADDALLVVTSDAAGSIGLPLAGRGVVVGTLAVSQQSLDFNGVALGDAGQRALRVTNQGDEPLLLLGVALGGMGEFSIQTSDCSNGRMLPAGAECDVITEFRPATAGDDKSAALTLSVQDSAPLVVQLKGAGLDPGALSLAAVAGSSKDFGAVLLGDERTQVFTIANGSGQTTGPLTVDVSGDFALVSGEQPGECISGQTALESIGASCNLTVKLVPTRRAAQYGSISIRSPLAKSASSSLTGLAIAPARLELVQDEINFGHVLSGGVYQAALTVLNQGDEPLPPLVATLVDPSGATPPGFSVDNGCNAPLGFQGSCALNIQFQPAQPGFPVALLRLASDGGNASAVLYGEVTPGGTLVLAAAADQSPSFGDVGIKTSKTVQFTLSNPGAAPTGRLSITASSPLFSIDPGDCNTSGQGLASGGACGFSVTYTPQAAEAVTATLSIQSPGAGGAALSLTGQGRSSASVVAEGNRDFGTASIGTPTATDPRNDFTWTIQNSGDLPTGTLQTRNSNPTDFPVVNDGCNGQSVAGHLSCQLSVQFRPPGVGPRTGDLIVTDATSGQSVTLKMTGSAVQFAGPGESCATGALCREGQCTAGVCCNVSCVRGCQECSTGTCTDQVNRERCGGNGSNAVCFGVDLCRSPEGEACTSDTACGSDNCEQRLGGNGVNDRVCCLQNCAPGDQCSPDGQGCQAPTLEEGSSCSTSGLPCQNGFTCKQCRGGGSQCTASAECCGGCLNQQQCLGGTCGCPAGTVDCQDGRCIRNQAGACCDNNGCTTTGGRNSCNSTSNTCVCPANAPRDCGNNVCIPNSQCCNCGGPCSTCNTNTGVCGTVPNGQAGNCGGGQVCQNGSCILNNVGLGQQCSTAANNCSVGSCVAGTCQCSGGTTACGGRCVNTQSDGANCGGCNINCGNPGCNGRGQCNCPAGQTLSGGVCRLNDGASCTPNGTPCLNGCTQWFNDGDNDGFGAGNAINTCGTAPPRAGLARQGNDCCDSDFDAKPSQTDSFTRTRTICGGFDFNCNNREEPTFRDVGGGPVINNILTGFADCGNVGVPPCNPNNVTLIWPGGRAAACGTLGNGGSQCAVFEGVCQGVSGFGIDVFCR
ncbi:MAG: choice-of-anchor D domain-containing protein [Deltaproteobacteria bacterium]